MTQPTAGIWRTTLAPAEETLIWCHDRHMALIEWRSPTSSEQVVPRAEKLQAPYYLKVCWVAAPTMVGQYDLWINGAATGRSISVVPPQPQRTRVPIGPDVVDWNPYLSVPNTELVLCPGRHKPIGNFTVAPNCGVSAEVYGSVVVDMQSHGGYGNKLATPNDYFTARRLIFESEVDCFLFHAYPQTVVNNLVEDCTIKVSRGEYDSPGLKYSRCNFKADCALLTSHTLVIDSVLDERDTQMSTWGSDCLAIIRTAWRGTGRGFHAQGHRGNTTHGLFYMLDFENIRGGGNAGEGFMDEGGDFTSCYMAHLRFLDCRGSAIQFWESAPTDNFFENIVAENTSGIWYSSGSRPSGNKFRVVELRHGGTIMLEGAATDELFEEVFVIDPSPSMYNQDWTGNPPGDFYRYRPAFDVSPASVGVVLKNCGTQGVQPGMDRRGPVTIEGRFMTNDLRMAG